MNVDILFLQQQNFKDIFFDFGLLVSFFFFASFWFCKKNNFMGTKTCHQRRRMWFACLVFFGVVRSWFLLQATMTGIGSATLTFNAWTHVENYLFWPNREPKVLRCSGHDIVWVFPFTTHVVPIAWVSSVVQNLRKLYGARACIAGTLEGVTLIMSPNFFIVNSVHWRLIVPWDGTQLLHFSKRLLGILSID